MERGLGIDRDDADSSAVTDWAVVLDLVKAFCGFFTHLYGNS